MPDYDMPDKMFHRSEEAPEAAQSPEVSSGGTGISSGDSAAALVALNVGALITEAMNAAFDCGAWDDEEHPEAYTPLAEKACATKEKLKAAVEALLSTQPAAPKQEPVDLGPWRYSFEDGRHFVESYDFTHDVRLYIDGDFAHAEDREAYGEMLAKRLNGGTHTITNASISADVQAAPAAPVGLDALREAVSDFRKAAFEFAKGMDPDDHKRMMEAQKRVFDAAFINRAGEQR